MGELVVLGPPGELRITWDRANPTEVRVAQFAYHTLLREGLTPFIPDLAHPRGTYKPAALEGGFNADVEGYTFVRPYRGG